MCKWIKDILWPTNAKGDKKQSFKVEIAAPPYNNVTFTVEWAGERLDICYCSLFRRGRDRAYTDHRLDYTAVDGDEGTQTFTVFQNALADRRTWVEAVYFECTNVTKLIINGEQFI